MALLDETNLTAEMTKRAKYRVHHVGTKLNERELHEVEALAAKRQQTHSELIRGLVLREIKQDAEGQRASLELVEITAVRLLIVNLLRPLATGGTMTDKTFDAIVEEAKKRKGKVTQGMVDEMVQKMAERP